MGARDNSQLISQIPAENWRNLHVYPQHPFLVDIYLGKSLGQHLSATGKRSG